MRPLAPRLFVSVLGLCMCTFSAVLSCTLVTVLCLPVPCPASLRPPLRRLSCAYFPALPECTIVSGIFLGLLPVSLLRPVAVYTLWYRTLA